MPNPMDMGSALIEAFVKIAKDPRGYAPDVALTERHCVVFPLDAFPVTAVQRVILGIHQEGQRYLEGIGDFRFAQYQLVVGTDARDRRQDAIAGEGQIKVEIPDRLDQCRRKPDLLAGFAQGSIGWGPVVRVDLFAGKRDLAGMARQLGAKREQHGGLGPVDNRNEHSGRSCRLDAGTLPERRLEIEIAARGRRRVIVERGRDVEGEPRARTTEEVVAGFSARQCHVHQASPFRLSAGTIAKNSPADATPNIRRPSMSRSWPSSTRS